MSLKLRVTPWKSDNEFKYVLNHLYSDEEREKRAALDRLQTWKTRVGDAKMPIAVECTKELVSAALLITGPNFNSEDLCQRAGIAMVITRFVNCLTEEKQSKGSKVHKIAMQIGIPKWVVDLRHAGTHGFMPGILELKSAVKFCLGWLKENFWLKMLNEMEDSDQGKGKEFDSKTKRRIDAVIEEYMDARRSRGEPVNGLPRRVVPEILRPLNKLMKNKHNKEYLANLLIQRGYLVPAEADMETFGIINDDRPKCGPLPPDLIGFWTPLINYLHEQNMESTMVLSIVTRLHQLNSRGQEVDKSVIQCLLSWAMTFIKSDSKDSVNSERDSGSPPAKRRKQVVSWNETVDKCIQKRNEHNLELLPSLLPLHHPPLSKDKQDKMLKFACLYVHGPNGLPQPTGIPPLAEMEQEVDRRTRHSKNVNLSDRDKAGCSHWQNGLGQVSGEEAAGGDANVEPWSIAKGAIEWSKCPIGMLPGQQSSPGDRRKRKLSSKDADEEPK